MNSSWYLDDADLSPSLDDSMSGMGADFVSSMFSMRDALSALPVCDDLTGDETGGKFEHPPVGIITEADGSSGHLCSRKDFVTVLKAPTSAATRYNEPSLTYLNQSQSYDLVLQRNIEEATSVKTLVTVKFHERRMELQEEEHMNSWKEAHPGEHLLDADSSLSHGFDDLSFSQSAPNTVVCLWSSPQCTLAIRLNCIGTEFTARKHGGEKGIPFRLQVDHFDAENEQHLHSCATQVKVFKMKGAERKHKTDREKLERKSKESQAQYRPSCPVTTLISLPRGHSVLPSKVVSYGGSDQCTQVPDARSPHDMCTSNLSETIDSDESTRLGPDQSFLNNGTFSESNRVEVVKTTKTTSSCFVTPARPSHRPTLTRTRRCSPGPSRLSPSPSRRLSVTLSSTNLQRRRRPRVSECCMGSCSACGRTCRNPGNTGARWARTSKTKPCCSHWEGTGSQRQPAWLPEKRRASQSYERNSAISCPQKVDKVTHSVNSAIRSRELSTSAESSLANEELSKWTLVDKKEEEEVEDSPLPHQVVQSEPLNLHSHSINETPSSFLSSRDAGYSSDLLCLTDSDSNNHRAAMRTLSFSAEPVCFQNHWEAPLESHAMDAQATKPSTSGDRDSEPRILVPASNEVTVETSSENLPIHVDMTPEQVAAWFKSSNLANLADTFQTFSGRDMLRLTKEDFLSLCGAVEGLRLHNAFYNKPPRPRSTIYLSRRANEVYQAVMLYHLTREELLGHIAALVSLQTEQIQMLCVLTEHGLPVLITDELVVQLEDRSCYLLEVHWQCPGKANIFLRPT